MVTGGSMITSGKDAGLATGFLAGDAAARCQVYEIVLDIARRDWRRIVSAFGNSVTAHDVAHEAWLRVGVALARYDPARPLDAFLCGLVRKVGHQMVGRLLRPPTGTTGDVAEQPLLEIVTQPADTDHSGALANFVRNAILPKLQDRQRPIALLYYIARVSPPLIAEALGRTPRSVHEALARISHRVAEELTEFLSEEDTADAPRPARGPPHAEPARWGDDGGCEIPPACRLRDNGGRDQVQLHA
jgi:RNA polymerase sigma factor (sigma-70 family)